jgi:uncharacterized membrane protein
LLYGRKSQLQGEGRAADLAGNSCSNAPLRQAPTGCDGTAYAQKQTAGPTGRPVGGDALPLRIVEEIMSSASPHFVPLAPPFFLALAALLGLLIALVELGLVGYAYEKVGVQRRYVFAVLLLSLLGSYVNIPVAEFAAERVVSGQEVAIFGMRYVIPMVEAWPSTVLAVNVGGAVIPTLLSLYLLVRTGLYGRALAGVAVVTAVVHGLAYPVEGMGIAVPMFIPPVVAAVTALLLSRQSAPPLAYIAGSLGTLIGADLLNLGQIQALEAPVASIGGAGRFDGIFMTGILAVLLA